MPKNTNRGGGRAHDFDPSYAKGGRNRGGAGARANAAGRGDDARKPGSRSPGHRGYRADEAGSAKKPRWSADERVASGRAPHRSDRDSRRFDEDGARPRFDRDDRPARRFDDRGHSTGRVAPRSDAYRDRRNDDRPARRFDDRPERRFDRDDRAPRREFGDRGERRFDRDARPARRFEERPERRFDRDERGYSAGRVAPRSDAYRDRRTDDRGERRFDRDDRPARRFDRDDRPARRFDRDERPARRFDRDDRAPRRDFGARDERRGPREFERAGFRDSGRAPSKFYGEASDRADRPAFSEQDDVVLERLEAQAIQADEVQGVGFADLGLGQNIVRALRDLGAEQPFPIQAATIPVVLEGRDVLGRGRTGSGKTIAFAAPAVERLMRLWAERLKDAPEGPDGRRKRQLGRAPRALILAPTRELALQIDRTVQPIAQSVGLFTTQVYGGVPQARQVGALRRGVDIVIGTPGRIEDLVEQGHLDLSEVVISVLDEADHMCDLGFLEPVQRILRNTSDGGQKLLFSATLDSGVANLVEEFLVEPAVHEVAGEDQASGTIEHRVFVIDNRDKRDIVAQLADRDGKTLVFARTRAFAEDLALHLEDAGIRAVALHGDLNQQKRTRNLERLTSGRVDVLVATDVAARGIHVDDIDLVIQADAPDEYKTYLHRAGRTGRAGRAGRVVTLTPRNRQRRLSDLLGRAEIEVEFEDVRLGDDVLVEVGAPAE